MAEARQQGIDVVLAAQLRGRLDAASGVLGGTVRTGDPTVAVKLSYDLIHVPTGQILAQRSIVREYQGEVSDAENANNTPEKVALRLVGECTSAMVEDITAHPETFEVALADASWGDDAASEMDQGNEAAAAGNWREAIDRWHAALETNPECHAAMYNLGVAFEQAGDLDGAVGWYAQAVAKKDEVRYQNALVRTEAGREPYRLAQRQAWRQRGFSGTDQRTQFAGAHQPQDAPFAPHAGCGGRQSAANLPVAMPLDRGGRF
jgi:hypothetical protein